MKTSYQILRAIKEFKRDKGYKFILEKSSCDEFFFDLTADVRDLIKDGFEKHFGVDQLGMNTHLEGRSDHVTGEDIIYKLDRIMDLYEYTNERMLIVGATIMWGLKKFIYENTGGLGCSCGVANNKLLAKLALPAHKSSGITILPDFGMYRFSRQIKINSIPSLK